MAGVISPEAFAQTVRVINMIPATIGNETNQDSEPDLTIDPNDPNTIIATAFTPNPSGSLTHAPVYVSTDGGATWALNNIVPSGNGMTGDITVTCSRSGVLCAGILQGGGGLDMRILRVTPCTSGTAMTQLVGRTQEDQPYARSITPTTGAQANNDLLYVGHNDFNNSPRTASLEQSLNAATAPPPAGLAAVRLERRAPSGQDGPPIRPAMHPDGTVYAVYTQRTASAGTVFVNCATNAESPASSTTGTPTEPAKAALSSPSPTSTSFSQSPFTAPVPVCARNPFAEPARA